MPTRKWPVGASSLPPAGSIDCAWSVPAPARTANSSAANPARNDKSIILISGVTALRGRQRFRVLVFPVYQKFNLSGGRGWSAFSSHLQPLLADGGVFPQLSGRALEHD